MIEEQMKIVRIDRQGRIAVPVALRRALYLEPGHVLLARVDDDRLIFERREAVLERLQARFAEAVPRHVSLSEELIAERREEVLREMLDD